MKKYLLLVEDEQVWEKFKESIEKDINSEIMELIREKIKSKGGKEMMGIKRKAQVTIFVIIAILIIAGGIVVYLFRDQIHLTDSIPQEFRPVFEYYQSCITEQTENAVDIAGTQGGYVYVPDYYPGSEYAPFSSQLNFLGFPVPYWYYISANGIIKEQAPSRQTIQDQISKYVVDGLVDCDLSQFEVQGFQIQRSGSEASAIIRDEQVNVVVTSSLVVSKGNETVKKDTHQISIQSKLGKFYNLAMQIYNKEKKEAFLENYSVDVLRLYAPVDGVEISCNPKIWKTRDVIKDLQNGLEANIGSLKLDGEYYALSKEENKYFVIDQATDEAVNFMYSQNWPSTIEVSGDGVDGELITANPVGTQAGLGLMGFCYVPYHFVYDVRFPVLVQIYDSNEIFQFPISVIVDNNAPRVAKLSEVNTTAPEVNICAYKTQAIKVRLFDNELRPIRSNATIAFECFDQRCNIGQTNSGEIEGFAPACVNGYVHARAEGYTEARELISTNTENEIDLFLDKEYDVNLDVLLDGVKRNNNVIITFISQGNNSRTVSAVLPDVQTVRLSQGSYEVRAYVYDNSSLTIPESKKEQCTEVPRSGLLGFFGSTKEKCFTINLPETKLDYALAGGGVSTEYFVDNQLVRRKMTIRVNSLPRPTSIEQLQNNIAAFDSTKLDITI